jgi:hypothetical protein
MVSETDLYSCQSPVFYTDAATFDLNYPYKVEWTLFQTHYFSENLALHGIEPRTVGSEAMNSGQYTTEAVTYTVFIQ